MSALSAAAARSTGSLPVGAAFAGRQGQQGLDEPLLLLSGHHELLESGAKILGGRVGVGEGHFEERPVEGQRGS